jgi:hypothetical protein
VKLRFSTFNNLPLGGSTPLHWCAESGSLECLRLVLNSEVCNLNDRDASGATALHWASGEGHVDIVSALIDFGGDINALDANNETPLHYCCLSGRLNCAKFFCEKGAKINVLSANGQTALHLATLNRFVDVVSLLIDYVRWPFRPASLISLCRKLMLILKAILLAHKVLWIWQNQQMTMYYWLIFIRRRKYFWIVLECWKKNCVCRNVNVMMPNYQLKITPSNYVIILDHSMIWLVDSYRRRM